MSGDGSIFKRTRTSPNGKEYVRWQVQVSAGPRSHRVRTNRTCRTRAEAVATLRELIADQREGRSLSRLPLGDYLRRWLDETERDLAPNTRRGYGDALEHLRPLFHVTVSELTADQIEACCNRMVNRKTGQPLAAKTVRNAQIMLRSCLESATQRGHVRRNEAKLVPLRRLARVRKSALTADHAKAVLAAVRADRYAAAYALALCGLRVSEVLGLAWADVADDCSSITVRWQVLGSGRRAVRRRLKSEASEAPLALPGFATSLLLAHKRMLPKGQLVFVTAEGYAVERSWLNRHLGRLLEQAGVERLTIHELRHGAATLLAAEGVHPRVAQAYLRHATSRVTQEVYTHTTAAQERGAAEALERAVAG